MEKLGLYQNKFEVDDKVLFSFQTSTNDFLEGEGTILGCSSRGILDFYIVELDRPLKDSNDRAIVVQSTFLTKLKIK